MSIDARPETKTDRSWEAGRSTEARRSPRRRTFAKVRVLAGPALDAETVATDFSAEGAFLRTTLRVERGTRLELELVLPTDPRPVKVAAVVVRAGQNGLGVRFEEVSARDRARLRSHAGFYEMDEAIVRVQRALSTELPGNLLPLGEPSEVETVLALAAERRLAVTVMAAAPGAARLARGTIAEVSAAAGLVRLAGVDPAVSPETRAVYVVFADPPLHYAFEGIVAEGGAAAAVLFPERIYLTERRSDGRMQTVAGYCEIEAPQSAGGPFRLPLLDLGKAGASVRIAPGFFFVPGLRLPAFTVVTGGGTDEQRRPVTGATVRYVVPGRDGTLRAGLRFDEGEPERETFKESQKRGVSNGGLGTRLRRGLSVLRGRLSVFLGQNGTAEAGGREDVEVVRYRNRRGDNVAGILDASFDTSDASIRPDVAVVIAPAFLKRKEVFGLFARTIVDDLARDGRKVVVLRFDATHTVGESAMDPQLVAEDRAYYRWTFGHLKGDIQASLAYVERRFRPVRRVLVSLSSSAIPGRKVVLESAAKSPVDLWIAPYGCPDAQDMLRNYLAGLDLFEVYRKGGRSEPLLIHGRPMDPDHLYAEALREGYALLEDARADMSRIGAPVVWILGEYDCWVTRSRVRALLEAPGGGPRETFVLPTGHVLKTGAEAIEVFKLAAESISRHLFNIDRPARDPDLERFTRQNEAEWARVKRLELADPQGFWHAHLFGSQQDAAGRDEKATKGEHYDVLLHVPDYRDFLRAQAALLEPRPGDHVADFGCGTGSFLVSLLEAYPEDEAPASITFLDIVPDAVHVTAVKIAEHYQRRGEKLPPYKGIVADLEISRLSSLHDFLEGRLHGVEALSERLEGFEMATARKVAKSYGRELHAILRGAPASPARLRALCPDLHDDEVEAVLEVGRASRFLRGDTLPEDRLPGIAEVRTPRDIKLKHLRLGSSGHIFGLGLPTEAFDRIGCSLVLSYLYDPLPVLREMHRILKPGGVLVVSSMRRDFDPSKLYADQATLLAERDPGKLDALRGFASFVGKLIELEEDGRFRFYNGASLSALVSEARFVEPRAIDGFGLPPTAVIVQCRKR